MLTAVQVAVVAAAAAFVAVAGVAVYVMLKAARLMSETSATVAGLRERGDLLIERANAAIDEAGEQIARAETVTTSMAGVTAAMTGPGGQITALTPAPPAGSEATSRPLAWAAALVYGVRWALGTRLAASQGMPSQPRQAGPWHGGPLWRQPRQAGPWHGGLLPGQPRRRADRPGRPARETARETGRGAALASRGNGIHR
jgi:hypothetical protein